MEIQITIEKLPDGGVRFDLIDDYEEASIKKNLWDYKRALLELHYWVERQMKEEMDITRGAV